jgi:4,5-dihydroxyphthalate decarboxylase
MARSLNVGVLKFDRTAALVDGRVRVDDTNFVNCPGAVPTINGLLGGAFDAADVPLVQYVYWKSVGMPITAIPVFSDRMFQHEYIYTRPDAGIESLADLRGRRVMCAPAYFATPAFWHRGLLLEEFGIHPEEVLWHVPRRDTYEKASVPRGISVTLSPASVLGVERLLDNTVDCLFTARTPLVEPADAARLQRVFKDAHGALRMWIEKNDSFPILHVIAVKSDAVAERPGFGWDLCEGFDRAKQIAYNVLQDERMTALPLMRGFLDETVSLFGRDPWPYGLARNADQLDRFLGYTHAQGFTPKRLSVDQLFDPGALDYEFKSKMTPGCIIGTADGGWAPNSVLPVDQNTQWHSSKANGRP